MSRGLGDVYKRQATGAEAKLSAHKVEGLSRLILSADKNTEVKWTLQCK